MLAATTVVYAAGLWESLPIVGGAARTVGSVTVPAGPTVVTGAEIIPADTGVTAGGGPATVGIPLRAIGAAPLTYNLCAGAVCGTVTLANNSGGVLFDYTTTITSATVQLPPAPIDGQRVVIASAFTITGLTVLPGAGTTLAVTTPTILTASTTVPQGYEYQYVASTLKWYRIS
jgi:hypothetical protein